MAATRIRAETRRGHTARCCAGSETGRGFAAIMARSCARSDSAARAARPGFCGPRAELEHAGDSSTSSPRAPVAEASIHVVGGNQSFLTRPREMDPDSRTARASELPACGVELGGARQVRGLRDLGAVGEAQALGAGARESKPHLT